MSLLILARKLAEEHRECGVTVEEEMPGVITDTVMRVSKPKVEIYLRPRIGYVNTCPCRDRSFMNRVKLLSKSAAEEGIELRVEPDEARLTVSRVKTFEEAIKAAEKILTFLKKHNLDWIP